MELLEQDSVTLVTEDNVFYQKNPDSMLSEELVEEVEGSQNSLEIRRNLNQLLEVVRVEVPLDEEQFSRAALEAFGNIPAKLQAHSFRLGVLKSAANNLFATESPDVLACTFTLQYDCISESSAARTDGLLTLEGECRYKTDDSLYSDWRRSSETLSYTDESGEQEKGTTFVSAQGISLGHRSVSYTARYPL